MKLSLNAEIVYLAGCSRLLKLFLLIPRVTWIFYVCNVAIKEHFVLLVFVSEVDLMTDARAESHHLAYLISNVVICKHCSGWIL